MRNDCGLNPEEFERVMDLMSVNSFATSPAGDDFFKMVVQVYRTIHATFMSKLYKSLFGDGVRFLFSVTQLLDKVDNHQKQSAGSPRIQPL
ncbi:hypothetical protein RRG08_065549 [Elysia crispata]|uniref:Uncharacterized protein n=1 Tax=Elysia crispata TaxID=231223 RepID=A0AAE0XF87_9GAST|nr:hypothetical protein RRG08_065549 [Elysia crispata]